VTSRSYHQHCGVAEALDVLGERWTLLILRDLLPGPQRFTDLARRQPGMGTDLLTSRLRRLEEHDLVERVPLPAPANGSMYQLTERGDDVRPVLAALARLGATWLPTTPTGRRRYDASWALTTIAEHLGDRAPTALGLTVTCDGHHHSLVVADDGTTSSVYGDLLDPAVRIEGPTRNILAVLFGRVARSEEPDVQITGDDADIDAWLDAIAHAVPFATR
jgi:DNA-binding HxlR family transcriptional regulator